MRQEQGTFALHKLRTSTGWYTSGLPGGRGLRLLLNGLETPEAFVEAVERYFESVQVAA